MSSPPPPMYLDKTTYAPGELLTLSINYLSDTTIRIVFEPLNGVLPIPVSQNNLVITTGAAGSVSLGYEIPANTPAGTYGVSVIREDTQVVLWHGSFEVVVFPRPPNYLNIKIYVPLIVAGLSGLAVAIAAVARR